MRRLENVAVGRADEIKAEKVWIKTVWYIPRRLKINRLYSACSIF